MGSFSKWSKKTSRGSDVGVAKTAYLLGLIHDAFPWLWFPVKLIVAR